MTPEEPAKSVLDLYVVYSDPLDYPGQYVVRQWSEIAMKQGCNHTQITMFHPVPLAITRSLDEARAAVPAGLTNIGRYEEDDPAIFEVWV